MITKYRELGFIISPMLELYRCMIAESLGPVTNGRLPSDAEVS